MDFDLNTAAYDDLIISMNMSANEGRIAFQLVNNSTSDENPSGNNAKIAWDRIVAEYKLSTAPRCMRLERELTSSKLAVGKNPDPWMTYTEQLVSEMNKCNVTGKSVKTDTDIILYILCHLSGTYEGIV